MNKFKDISNCKKHIHITATKHKVLIKKIDNFLCYSTKNNQVTAKEMRRLFDYVKNNSFKKITRDILKQVTRYTTECYKVNISIKTYDFFILKDAYELIEYSKNNGFELCQYFYDDLYKIENQININDDIHICRYFLKNYINKVWRDGDVNKVKSNGYYIAKTMLYKKREVQYTRLKKHSSIMSRGLDGRFMIVFTRATCILAIITHNLS